MAVDSSAGGFHLNRGGVLRFNILSDLRCLRMCSGLRRERSLLNNHIRHTRVICVNYDPRGL